MTIDEPMLCYKEAYGHDMCEYMPKKLVKFGSKTWAAADANSKYLYNFQVYTSAKLKKLCNAKRGETKNGYKVVMELVEELHG